MESHHLAETLATASDTHVCAIVIAAGPGSELIWSEAAGKPLLAWTVAAFEAAPSIARILLVVPADEIARAELLQAQEAWRRVGAVLPGGNRRREGVEAAMRTLDEDCDLVAIHDATRPLVTLALIEAGVALARERGAAIPAEPVKETIKRVRAGVIVGTVPRERLARAQSPQVFARARLQEAYHRAAPELDPPDEAALSLRVGLPVTCYAGDPENLRVTSADDLLLVDALLQRRND
jgi:2-C-methyl-D-erythritol 4-phosphate cytidylyltransferase